MVLIRKSASDIENEYKRVFIRFLKESNLFSLWYQYVNSPQYRKFAEMYASKYRGRSALWYDRHNCIEIMGMCNFYHFIHMIKGLKGNYEPYDDLILFMAIFWEEEYEKWAKEVNEKKSAKAYVEVFLSYQYYGNKDKRARVERWVKLKQTLG